MGTDSRTKDPEGYVRPSAPDRPVAAKIVVVSGVDEGLEVPLDSVVEIGTDEAVDLVLRDPAVSRRHASVAAIGGRFLVKDLGSRNGTFLGATRLNDATVSLGDVLTLGNSNLAIQSR